MTTAVEQQLWWQSLATWRIDEESWQAERDVRRTLERMSERHEDVEGWLPPRQSDAEALEPAVMVADRYQRQFLCLLRALRDVRRVLGTVIVPE